MKDYYWLIDMGHGPKQPGKRSPKHPNGIGIVEWEFNRDLAYKLHDLLNTAGVPNRILYDTMHNIAGADLQHRVNLFNGFVPPAGTTKVLLSIHANAHGTTWNDASGVETWIWKGNQESKRMAHIFQRHLQIDTKMRNRGVKETTSFYLHKHCNGPVLLTENGFYTNEEECRKLMTSEFRQTIAEAHAKAIIEISMLKQ
jgi:N-acetylmuramoyl-L-alanine amidase